MKGIMTRVPGARTAGNIQEGADTTASRRSKRVARPFRLGVVVAMLMSLVGTSVLVSAPPASAAGPYITSDASLRSCVTTSNGYCAPFATFPKGTPVTMVCWIDGSSATGAYTSNRWFLVRRGDGYEGFVHSSLVGSQASSPSCNTIVRVKAGLQAIQRLGQITANATDAARFTDWAPGPYGEWSGDCKKLVSVAYRDAGLPLIGGNAKPTFDTYYASRSQRGGGLPRYGALVGFNTYLPYGHIAVAIGGNRIATTNGTDGQKQANSIRTTSSFAGYAGWVVP